jgi:hypothetical protein
MYDKPLSEKEWQARDDAHTLIQAERIKLDKDRLKEAKMAASRLQKEREDELKVFRKVAGSVTTDSQTKNSDVKINRYPGGGVVRDISKIIK